MQVLGNSGWWLKSLDPCHPQEWLGLVLVIMCIWGVNQGISSQTTALAILAWFNCELRQDKIIPQASCWHLTWVFIGTFIWPCQRYLPVLLLLTWLPLWWEISGRQGRKHWHMSRSSGSNSPYSLHQEVVKERIVYPEDQIRSYLAKHSDTFRNIQACTRNRSQNHYDGTRWTCAHLWRSWIYMGVRQCPSVECMPGFSALHYWHLRQTIYS